ncbi:hypothetical protein BDV40DRAFT_270388 [Aspergillus tamarii]|uniref:Uncharacterized protein n=1 Tax=Aspergillus tamarii TaxID=41984 RepID=A0A5N6UPE1_ASPTM|nr:hypothetical protein BDV40DRAFT_270388 [Aspergillus tamarii]
MDLTQAGLHLQQHQEASTEPQKEAQLQDRDQLLLDTQLTAQRSWKLQALKAVKPE